jgi:mRNA interferase RelE/StbE
VAWRFDIRQRAELDIGKLDVPIQHRVKEKLTWFVGNFDKVLPVPLGYDLKGFYKLRVGDWRIVYEVKEKEKEIIVHAVDRRDKVYKRTQP